MDNIEKEKIDLVHKPELVVGQDGTRSVGASPGSATVVPLDLSDDELVGSTLDSGIYIQALIGKGGMSSVYRGEQLMIGRTVAVKMLHSLLFSEASAVMRFQQEAKAVGALDHPGIIKVHEFRTAEKGRSYLVMEHVEGITLSQVISKSGVLDWRRARNIFSQACGALDHAHKRGVVHRDLKPSNVMLVKSDHDPDFVKILDFGIAKLLAPEIEGQKLTQTGEVFGSPLYMSPEQCTAQKIDHRSDIYSLGCVLYEALTGKPPLSGSNIYQTIFKHTSEMPASLRAHRPELEHLREFEAVVLKAMAKNPACRFQSMGEFKLAIEAIGQNEIKSVAQKVREQLELAKRKRGARKTLGPPSYTIPAMLAVFAAVLALSWNTAMQHGASTQTNWQSLYESGQASFDKGNYRAADDYFKQAKEKAKQDPSQLFATVNEMIDLQRAQGLKADAGLVQFKSKLESDLRKQLDQKIDFLASELQSAKETGDKSQLKRICNDINDCVASLMLSSTVFDEAAQHALTLALNTSENFVGSDSIPAARSAHNLALIAFCNQDYKKAHKLFEQALTIRRNHPDDDPMGLLKTLEWQARTERQLGNAKASQLLLEERLDKSLRLDPSRPTDPSPTNINAARSKLLLAEHYHVQNSLDKASDLLADASSILSTQPQAAGNEELAICEALSGDIKFKQGKMNEAEPLLMAALKAAEANPQKLSGYLVTTLKDLADIYAYTHKNPAKAEPLWRRALVVALRGVPRDERAIRDLEDRLKDSPILINLLKTRLDLDKAVLKPESPVLVWDLCDLARVERQNGNIDAAIDTWSQVLAITQKVDGNHIDTLEIKVAMAEAYLDRKNPTEALKSYTSAVEQLASQTDRSEASRAAAAQKVSTSMKLREKALPESHQLLKKLEELQGLSSK